MIQVNITQVIITNHDAYDMWTYGIGTTYTKDEVSRVEIIYGCLSKVFTLLLTTDCHPEMDKSPIFVS